MLIYKRCLYFGTRGVVELLIKHLKVTLIHSTKEKKQKYEQLFVDNYIHHIHHIHYIHYIHYIRRCISSRAKNLIGGITMVLRGSGRRNKISRKWASSRDFVLWTPRVYERYGDRPGAQTCAVSRQQCKAGHAGSARKDPRPEHKRLPMRKKQQCIRYATHTLGYI